MVGLTVVVTVSGLSATALELSPVLAMIGVGNGLVIPLIVQGVLQSVPSHRTGAASGMLTTTQQFAMVLGIAGVGTLFFAREATSGIVSALQFGLFADIALVAFALGMTFLLPRAKPAGAMAAAEDKADERIDMHVFEGAL